MTKMPSRRTFCARSPGRMLPRTVRTRSLGTARGAAEENPRRAPFNGGGGAGTMAVGRREPRGRGGARGRAPGARRGGGGGEGGRLGGGGGRAGGMVGRGG